MTSSSLMLVLLVFVFAVLLAMARPRWLWMALICSSFWYPAITGATVAASKQMFHVPLSLYDVSALSLLLSAFFNRLTVHAPPVNASRRLVFVWCGVWFATIGLLRLAISGGGSPAVSMRACLWMVVVGLAPSVPVETSRLLDLQRQLALVVSVALLDLVRREVLQGALHGGYALGSLVVQKAALSMSNLAFLLAFCVALCWVMDAGWSATKGVLVVASALGVAVSMSRSNMLALAGVVLWFMIWSRGRARSRIGSIVLVMVVVVMLSPVGQLVASRFSWTGEGQSDASVTYRITEMRRIPSESVGSLDLLLFGHGAGAWIPSDLAVLLVGSDTATSIHNEWLRMLYDFGVIGVLIYAWMYWVLWSARTPQSRALRAMIVAWLIVSFSAGELFAAYSWLWIGWVMNLPQENHGCGLTHSPDQVPISIDGGYDDRLQRVEAAIGGRETT